MWVTILYVIAILILLIAEYPVYRSLKQSPTPWPWLGLGGALLLLICLYVLLLYRFSIPESPDFPELATALIVVLSALLIGSSVFRIAERVQALTQEKEQIDSENRLYRLVGKHLPFPWVLKDHQTAYLVANPAYEALLGKEGEELAGKKDSDLFPEAQADLFLQADELAMQQSTSQDHELEVADQSGTRILRFTHTPIQEEDGSMLGVLVTSQDISERKQLESVLKEKLQALQAAYDEKDQALEMAKQDKELAMNNMVLLFRFERLLASIAAYFIDLEATKIDQGILYALLSIGRQTGVDRCHLLLFSKNNPDLVPAYEWNAEGENLQRNGPVELGPSGSLWTSFGQMEVVHVATPSVLPAESATVADFMATHDIKSFTAVPLISDRSVIGYLWFESNEKTHHWEPEFLELLRMAGQIFVHILDRKYKYAELTDAQEKMKERLTLLEQRSRENSLLNELGDLLQVCRTVDEAFPIIARYTPQLIPADSGALYLIRNVDDPAERVASWGEVPPGETEMAVNECWALRRGRLHQVSDLSSGLICSHLKPPLPASYLCSPLIAQGESIGLLHLRRVDTQTAHEPPLDDEKRLASMVSENIALALSNLSLRDKLRSQAIRDPLTGLFNRRYMEETLEREIRRAIRHATSVGMIMFDVDHLKNINDAYGHDAGDVVLENLGNLLLRSFRGEDVPCRYGGDEFTIILPEASVSEVFRRAEQLREAFKKLEFEHEGRRFGHLTLSIGIVAHPDHGSTVERLLQTADAASYAAKTQGRDRVMIGGSLDE